MGGQLDKADDRLAAKVVEGERRRKPSVRRYRCSSCGLLVACDELRPDVDETGRRFGWQCEDCW